MKNILIISLLGVFGFFTGCAPVTCEELDRHAFTLSFKKDLVAGKFKINNKVAKADIYKTGGSKKIAKKTYADEIEAAAALKKGAEAKLKCKFSKAQRNAAGSYEMVDGDDEVDLADFKSDFETYEKESKEELKKLK